MQETSYDIYAIKHNDNIVYIGSTGLGIHRWVCHKTKARNPNKHSRFIHNYMRDNTKDPSKFPEFSFEVIATCHDEDIAKDLEKYFQKLYGVPNRYTRPLQFSDKIERRTNG
jgi:hypothetical protein